MAGPPASGGGAQRKRKKREERKAQAERDKLKRMAKTGRGDAAASAPPANRRKTNREPESMLSEELAAELAQDGMGMSVEEFIVDPKAPKPQPKLAPSPVEVKMSNS
eukprot:COSAG02_NODE_46455_length_348_cov_2.473896_1_plen_106_part_01